MSNVEAVADRPGRTGLAAWLHFVGLLALGLGANALKTVATAGPGDSAIGAVLEMLPRGLFHLIPAVAAISIGVLAFRPSVFRQAVILAVVTTILMVGLDLAGTDGPFGSVQVVGVRAGGFGSARVLDPTGVSAIGTVVALLEGKLAGWQQMAASYPPDHPRLRAALALVNGVGLLLPGILVGMITGIQAWFAENATFRTPAARRIHRLLVAWFVSAAAYYLVMSWCRAVMIRSLLRSGTLLPILIPLLPFVVAGALGWLMCRRATRFLD
jgi:hypothetical protein